MSSKVIFLLLIINITFRQISAKCAGGFDIYFILDKSRSLSERNFQIQTVQFVEDVILNLSNSKTRISLITFSETASLDLPLTGDRNEIKKGIDTLRKIVPNGRTYLNHGIDEATKQIKEKGLRTASVVFILTDGELSEKGSFKKAKHLRDIFHATIFAIGIDNYIFEELRKLASEPSNDYVYTVTNYDTLNSITAKIVNAACVELTSAQPATVCAGSQYNVTLYGKGFKRTRDISSIRCNFRYNDAKDYISAPTEVSDTLLKCQGPVLQAIHTFVILQVSLNKDKFISSDITVTAVNCIQPNRTKTILVIIFLILILGLVALWWFFFLLPCVNEKTKDEPPLIPLAETDEKRKWPTVDASLYGGGGIGGIKPVKVKWGEKGATDEGNKLTKSPDANVLENPLEKEVNVSSRQPSVTILERVRKFCVNTKLHLIQLGRLLLSPYKKCAAWRPHKNSKSKFYSNSAERKRILA